MLEALEQRRPQRIRVSALAALGAGVAALLLAGELDSAWRVLNGYDPLTARDSKLEVSLFQAAAAAIAALALAGRRPRTVAALAPAAVAVVVLAGTATFGGQGISLLAAALSMLAPWVVGERLLIALGVPQLAASPLVAWLSGLGPLCILTTLLGRASLLRGWSWGC